MFNSVHVTGAKQPIRQFGENLKQEDATSKNTHRLIKLGKIQNTEILYQWWRRILP